MTRVSASSASSSTSSPTPRSASLPTETSLAKPRPRAAPRESTVPSIVPLCETRLVVPAGGASISRTPFTVRATRPGRFTTPMLLGPSRRTPSSRARAGRRQLHEFLLELALAQRHLGIALARGLQQLLAPAARRDRHPRRAPAGEGGVELRIDGDGNLFHQLFCFLAGKALRIKSGQ